MIFPVKFAMIDPLVIREKLFKLYDEGVAREDIAQLQAICSRGRIDVIAALQRTGGNVEAAANILLSQDR